MGGNPNGIGENLNLPRGFHGPPTQMMTGYGRVPLNLQQQGPRLNPYLVAPARTERKFDPDMTLEEALNGNWCIGNTVNQHAVGNNPTVQEVGGQRLQEQAECRTVPLCSNAARGPRTYD